MAAGELSTRITTLPSRMEAAVSGLSENLNLGKGLYHLLGYRHSAKLSWFMVRASTWRFFMRSLIMDSICSSTRPFM